MVLNTVTYDNMFRAAMVKCSVSFIKKKSFFFLFLLYNFVTGLRWRTMSWNNVFMRFILFRVVKLPLHKILCQLQNV
jgi:hypothetical protein